MAVGDVKQAPVLNIAIQSDLYPINVGADDRMKPDAAVGRHGHLSDQDSGRGDEARRVNLWGFPVVGVDGVALGRHWVIHGRL